MRTSIRLLPHTWWKRVPRMRSTRSGHVASVKLTRQRGQAVSFQVSSFQVLVQFELWRPSHPARPPGISPAVLWACCWTATICPTPALAALARTVCGDISTRPLQTTSTIHRQARPARLPLATHLAPVTRPPPAMLALRTAMGTTAAPQIRAVTTAAPQIRAHSILYPGRNLSYHPATAILTGTRQHTAARGTLEPMAGPGRTLLVTYANSLTLPCRGGTHEPIGGLEPMVGPGRTPRVVDATSLALPRRGGTHEPIGDLCRRHQSGSPPSRRHSRAHRRSLSTPPVWLSPVAEAHRHRQDQTPHSLSPSLVRRIRRGELLIYRCY